MNVTAAIVIARRAIHRRVSSICLIKSLLLIAIRDEDLSIIMSGFDSFVLVELMEEVEELS